MASTASPTPATRPSILVVDDDRELTRMLALMLAEIGEVRTCHDGTEALAALEGSWAPSAIVTDAMMPEMDGLTLVSRLKQDTRHAKIPVIMLSAKTTPADVIRGINAGVRSYVCKPFQKQELLSKVRRALGS